MRVLADELTAGGGDGFQVDAALRNKLTPMLALRRGEAGGIDVPLGCFRIRENEKLVAAEDGIKRAFSEFSAGTTGPSSFTF